MASPVEVKPWACDVCRTAYGDIERAEKCERDHRTIEGARVTHVGYKKKELNRSGFHPVRGPRDSLPDSVTVVFPGCAPQTYHYVPPRGV